MENKLREYSSRMYVNIGLFVESFALVEIFLDGHFET